MKITGLKTFVANVSRTNFVFVKLYTDDGIDGVGEAALEWKTLVAPTAAGLGVELNEEACARFPYAPHDVPLFDGSINVSGVATGAAVMTKAQR